ncbi:MAG: hypothetical protein JXR46_07235 [Calditrichaceae bacterium]|nr:hypothetical protein [Calditrichaceae bacterium]MBN2708823.1 hypothetical protein [Calditrichaceae bacterium]RQV97648.1 MAG: hypothetical protein EH224_01120 [Calditrichota bacterium]
MVLKNKFLIFVLYLILTLTGCNPFGPAETDGEGSTIITNQKTPDEVFTNFAYAYNFKDTVVYSDLLDSSFLFIAKNYATTPVSEFTWGRDIDIRATSRMFNAFHTINLIWIRSKDENFTPDNTEYSVYKIYQLTMDGGTQNASINGEAYFELIKKNINPKDSTGTWLISKWLDLATF